MISQSSVTCGHHLDSVPAVGRLLAAPSQLLENGIFVLLIMNPSPPRTPPHLGFPVSIAAFRKPPLPELTLLPILL